IPPGRSILMIFPSAARPTYASLLSTKSPSGSSPFIGSSFATNVGVAVPPPAPPPPVFMPPPVPPAPLQPLLALAATPALGGAAEVGSSGDAQATGARPRSGAMIQCRFFMRFVPSLPVGKTLQSIGAAVAASAGTYVPELERGSGRPLGNDARDACRPRGHRA